MNKPYYKLNIAEFLPWLANFIAVARRRQAELPITTAQLAALDDFYEVLLTKLNAQLAAEEAANSATRDVNDEREGVEDETSFFNTTFKAGDRTPPELLEALGLPVSGGAKPSSPVEPLDLTVTPHANGDNDLKFDRSDNPKNTIFVYEAQFGDSPDWTYLVATSDTRYTHRGQKPGNQVAYRVKATRKGESSPWSVVAVAYFKG